MSGGSGAAVEHLDVGVHGRHADARLRGGRRGFILRRLLALSDMIALFLTYGAMLAIMSVFGRDPLGSGDFWLFLALLPVWFALGTPLKLYHVGERALDYSVADEAGPVFMVATVWNWGLLMARSLTDPRQVLEVLPSFLLWGLSIVLVLGLRIVVVSICRRLSWYRQRVVLLGSSADTARVTRRVLRHPEWGLEVAGAYEVDGLMDRENGRSSITHAIAIAQETEADRVMLASTTGNLAARSELIRDLIDTRIQVDLVSGEPDLCSSSAASLHYLEGLPVLTVPSVQVPRTWKSVKRIVDLTASALGVLVLAPFFAIAAIGIKLGSPGPVLFHQRRVGRQGREFALLKLRTMVEGADQMKSELAARNMHNGGLQSQMFKIPDDPRITRFGAFLRRWSLDELPQLWNVLKGEMSLVGPRPLIPSEAELVEGRYGVRLEMRPGITGPWQTMGRSDIGFEDMVKLDYTYVMNWTLAEDFKILIRTGEAVLHARGSY